jgi:PTS system nitrogen regulatory IIA component
MKISDLLSPGDVMIDVSATDKQKLLRALARKGGSIVGVMPERVLAELQRREELGSTGIGGGVALPHARFHQVDRPIGALVRLRKRIDFEAVDGEPVDLVFLLLLPEAPEGDQLGALASIARKLRNADVPRAWRTAADGPQMYRALTSDQG